VALLVRVIAGDGFPGWPLLVGPIGRRDPVADRELAAADPAARAEREQTI
jgi:hypothetical protein